LVIGFVIMCFNSLYQYSWNALEPLIRREMGISIVQASIGFALFNIFSSLFQPLGGHFADKYGPRRVGVLASFLSALGFLGAALSPSILAFYAVWSLGSVGEGILYGIAANLAIKWFRERMGVATGLVSVGFGLGSAIANPMIVATGSFRESTLIIGLTEVIVLPTLLSLVDYPRGLSGRSPSDVTVNMKFWLIYFSFVGSVTPLIVLSSSLQTLGVHLSRGETTLLISLLPLLSGLARPIFGYIGDRLGIVRTVLLLNLMIIMGSLTIPLGRLDLATILIGFSGGSLITLYFNVTSEVFGTRFSTVNTGILYTGKALAGVLGSAVFSYLYSMNLTVSEIYVICCAIAGSLLILAIKR